MVMLPFDKLYDGYSKTLDNAERLAAAGLKLFSEYPEISLGLFELGQEEIGKSFTFLAIFLFADTPAAEEFLFKDWKSHSKKAHRAFLYELISPMRVIVKDVKGNEMSGGSARERMHHEKEASFYVNYNTTLAKFLSPQDDIKKEEIANRGGTLLSLLNTAYCVKTVLDTGADKARNYKLFSDLTQRLLSLEIYQKDIPAIFDSFSRLSPDHASIISNLSKALQAQQEIMQH